VNLRKMAKRATGRYAGPGRPSSSAIRRCPGGVHSGGVHSGDPILVGGFFGVANYDAEQTLPVEITLGGVWQLPKAATVTFAVGAAVYFDAAAGNVTSVSTRGNKLIGAATQCAGASDAVAIVRLNGVSV
jgi:predicted RecA/RadA family phage recombinase